MRPLDFGESVGGLSSAMMMVVKRSIALTALVVATLLLGSCADDSLADTPTVRTSSSLAVTTSATSPATSSTTTAPTTSTATTATTEVRPAGDSVSFVDYTDEEDGFSISYPEGWAAFTEPDPEGGVTALFAGPGYPNGASVYVFTNEPEPGTTLEEYVEWRIADIRAGSPGQEFIEQGATALGGEDAWFVAYAATLHPEETTVFFGEVIGLRDGHGYIVTYASPLDTWREWSGVQGPMVLSFNPPPPGS